MLRTACTAITLLALAIPPTAQAQDADLGQRSFGKCRACHQVGETAKNGIGPTLNGLFARHSGTVPGYAYTEANKNAGITWSAATFADYIKDPKASIPGTKMVFAGLKDEKEIADLTAYLQQFAADGKKSGS